MKKLATALKIRKWKQLSGFVSSADRDGWTSPEVEEARLKIGEYQII